MTFATHAVVGVAVAQFFPAHPGIGFVAALASHYLSDMLPHWNLQYQSVIHNPAETTHTHNRLKFSPRLWWEIGEVLLEFVVGGLLAIFLYRYTLMVLAWPLIIAGLLGGVLPDVLQFLSLLIKRQPFIGLQKIHDYFHVAHDREITQVIPGLLWQIAFILVIVVSGWGLQLVF